MLAREGHSSGGLVGKIAGKAKEVAWSLVGNDKLAREGRLQRAQREADDAAAERRAREREAERLEQRASL